MTVRRTAILLLLAIAGWRFCHFVYLFAYWVPFSGGLPDWAAYLPLPAGIALGLSLGLDGAGPEEPTIRTTFVAALVGAVLGGALGCDLMLAWSIASDANQGPIVAIFALGPLGAIAGAIVGASLHALRRRVVAPPAP